MTLGDVASSSWRTGLARRVYELLGDPEADLVEAAVAGLKTVQLFARYDRGVIIDCICDGSPVGQVRRPREGELDGACLG